MDYPISRNLIALCRAHRKTAERQLYDVGLHAGQEAILLRLVKREGLSHSELAGELGVEAPTVTKAIQRLEKAGFVKRQPDPVDGRVSRVYLTDAGRQLEPEIREIWKSIEGRLTLGLSAAEKLLLQRMLSDLLTNLQAE